MILLAKFLCYLWHFKWSRVLCGLNTSNYNFQGSRLYLIKKIKVYNAKGVYLSFTRIDISKLASA